MTTEDYQNLEDFILDESFREYAMGSSEASLTFWKDWLKSHPEKESEVRKASQILVTLLNHRKLEVPFDKNKSLAELLQKIESENISEESARTLIPFWLKIAAVIVFSVGLGWLGNWSFNSKSSNKELVFNEIIVPIGEKSQVVLSDGTHVWINSGSRLKYPVNFGKETRQVYLSGEAFFDVIHQETQTFVVNTHDARVKVLGTAFNVKAYPEDAKTQTTVVRGLVSVQNIHKHEEVQIKPNQMAVVRKDSSIKDMTANKPLEATQVLKNVNVEAVTCWKNQLLVFADEPLEDMAMKMERWFNVKIVIEDSTLRHERYNGKFVHNETIYEVLKAIKQTTSIKYSIEDNKIFIARK